jgi:ribonuclease D
MARGGTGGNTNQAVLAQEALDDAVRERMRSRGFVFVDNKDLVKEAVAELAEAPSVALDIETAYDRGDGVHNGTISLIQLGIDPDRKWVFDMYALHDPRWYKPMLSLLRRNDQRHVVHHAIFEQPWLWYALGVRIGRLFDTEEAAILLRKAEGHKEPVNLASVLKRELGITISKDVQSSDWGKRPLTFRQKEYAADDVAHLNALADIQEARLRELNLLDELYARCDARYPKTLLSIRSKKRYEDDDFERVKAMVDRSSSKRELEQLASELPTFVLAHHHRAALRHQIDDAITRRKR